MNATGRYDDHGRKDHLHIFVNDVKFDEGLTHTMTVNAVAQLAGMGANVATVRRRVDGRWGEALAGTIEIFDGEHFVVDAKKHLHIFVNHKRYDEGLAHSMVVDALAQLVGMTDDTAVVRRVLDGKPSDPLTDTIEIHEGDHFIVVAKKLHIFVNRKKFDEGITAEMTVDAIARFVGMTAATATVRRLIHGKAGDPLSSLVEIHQADQFTVTRNAVQGGHEAPSRIALEVKKLIDSGQRTTLTSSPPAVVYYDLPVTAPNAPVASTDVLVPVPAGYPGAMLDLAFLPHGSPLIGQVQGQPQQVL